VLVYCDTNVYCHLCGQHIEVVPRIVQAAEQLVKRTGLAARDALHVAAILLTCDNRVERTAAKGERCRPDKNGSSW
jgi:hypothetical protein